MELIKVNNQLVHAQRVSSITCRKTTEKADEVDEEGTGWKNGSEFLPDAMTGSRRYVDVPREKRVAPPYWTIAVLLSGGSSVVVKVVRADTWLDEDQAEAEALANEERDAVAKLLGFDIR